MQHRAIAQARCGPWVRRIEQGLDLLAVEVADQSLIGFFHRNGTDLPRLLKAGRHSVFQEAKKRVNSCEPCVAGAGRTPPLNLDVLEECEDERDIQLVDGELGWPDTEAASGEADQKLEGISVGFARVRTGLALAR